MIKIFILAIIMVILTAVIAHYAPRHRRGSADQDLIIVVPIAKTIYKVAGHFSKTSKMTAKNKVERLIKKEIQK